MRMRPNSSVVKSAPRGARPGRTARRPDLELDPRPLPGRRQPCYRRSGGTTGVAERAGCGWSGPAAIDRMRRSRIRRATPVRSSAQMTTRASDDWPAVISVRRSSKVRPGPDRTAAAGPRVSNSATTQDSGLRTLDRRPYLPTPSRLANASGSPAAVIFSCARSTRYGTRRSSTRLSLLS